MKTKTVFWGMFFLGLGGLLLLQNITPLNMNAAAYIKFWPLCLVLFGLSFIVTNQPAKTALAGLTGLLVAVMVFSITHKPWRVFHWESNRESYSADSTPADYSAPFDGKIKRVNLTFNAGAGELNIGGHSNELFKLMVPGQERRFDIDTKVADSTADVTIKMKDVNIQLGDNQNNDLNIEMRLNKTPVYNLEMEIGAAASNIDLREYKIAGLKFKVGAASLDIQLGEPALDSTIVEMEIGAASVDLEVPRGASVEIRTEMSLSSFDYTGFKKISDNLYRSDNFSQGGKSYYLLVKGGVSSFDVRRN